MSFLSGIIVSVIKWIIETSISLAVKWAGKKKEELDDKKTVDHEVSEVEALRAEIIAYKKRGEKVPKDLEDKLRLAMSRLNDQL